MGVDLKDIIPSEPLELSGLRGKVIAIDALNSLYQFLASIRQPDGTPLMNSRGQVTSHLSGLLYRTTRLMKLGIKPVYVYDGKPPELKQGEIRRRSEAKDEAHREWVKAKREGRLEDARKYAQRTSRFTDEMLADSKKLLDYMGVPHVQAPSEGEAQCVHMCIKGDVWVVGSQDYDALLFGAPRLVRGLTLSGKLESSIIYLDKVLESLKLSREQLIELALLVGTDFNEGVKGIGPKKALRIVGEGRLGELELEECFSEVKEFFLNPLHTDDYSLEWRAPQPEGLMEFLCSRNEFSENRVRNVLRELEEVRKEFSQQSIDKWF